MDYWNDGMEIFKSLFSNFTPNKAHTQHINTLYVLNEVSINSSNDGNMKKTSDLTLICNHIVANSENKINGGL